VCIMLSLWIGACKLVDPLTKGNTWHLQLRVTTGRSKGKPLAKVSAEMTELNTASTARESFGGPDI
jgi:hypothetical protein